MNHINLFNSNSEYELYKNSSDYILPNISYIEEIKSVKYKPKKPKKTYILRAKYNATPDNLVAFTGATNVTSLNVNGTLIKVEPIKNEITTFDVLGENISMNLNTGEATFPESYLIKSPVSNWSFKAKDPNYVINENTYICMLAMMDGMMIAQPIPPEEMSYAFTTNDGVTIEVDDSLLTEMNMQIQSGMQIGFTLVDINENNNTFIFIDTEHQTNVTTGGLSTYSFDSEGLYDVEIGLADSDLKIKFAGTPLTSIEISDDITSIGAFVFYDSLTEQSCDSLTSITIGKGVTHIGNRAFYNCFSLTSVYISDIAAWCNISFKDLYSNPLDVANNLYLNNELITDLIIPNSVGTIENYAFSGCTSIASVTIPNSVTTIGDSAFQDCGSLTSVTIPNSVTTIGGYAFAYCDNLTSVTIGDSVTTIGDAAFADCKSMTKFTGKFAEDNGRCLIVNGTLNSFAPVGLTEYTIPDGVTTIGEDVFRHCDNLTSVTIPDGVTEIGYGAFYYCRSLTSTTIPDSVTKIGDWAFAWCSNLTSVYCKSTTPPALDATIGIYVFYNIGRGYKIYVPSGSVEAYKSAEWWSRYSIVGYDF